MPHVYSLSLSFSFTHVVLVCSAGSPVNFLFLFLVCARAQLVSMVAVTLRAACVVTLSLLLTTSTGLLAVALLQSAQLLHNTIILPCQRKVSLQKEASCGKAFEIICCPFVSSCGSYTTGAQKVLVL